MKYCPTIFSIYMNTSKVNRVEVIDWRALEGKMSGRAFAAWEDELDVELQLQDDERTLKIFIR